MVHFLKKIKKPLHFINQSYLKIFQYYILNIMFNILYYKGDYLKILYYFVDIVIFFYSLPKSEHKKPF